MWKIEADELADAFGALAELFAECHYGNGILVNDEALAYRTPRLEAAAKRTYHFRLHETGRTWWELNTETVCAATPVGNGSWGWLEAHAVRREIYYSIWPIPALGGEPEDDLVDEGLLERDAVLPSGVDQVLMELAIIEGKEHGCSVQNDAADRRQRSRGMMGQDVPWAASGKSWAGATARLSCWSCSSSVFRRRRKPLRRSCCGS